MPHMNPSPQACALHVSRASALAALTVALLLAVAGCGANLSPVLNVGKTPITGAQPGADPTPHVRQAILRAIASRGWTIDQEQPGLITTTARKGDLFAQVDVAYTAETFAITHRNSAPGFKFDGERIHKRYNHWVDRLRASILSELNRTTPAGAPVPAIASPD